MKKDRISIDIVPIMMAWTASLPSDAILSRDGVEVGNVFTSVGAFVGGEVDKDSFSFGAFVGVNVGTDLSTVGVFESSEEEFEL